MYSEGENVPVAQFETDARSHVVVSLSVRFYILFNSAGGVLWQLRPNQILKVRYHFKSITVFHSYSCDTPHNARELPSAIRHHAE